MNIKNYSAEIQSLIGEIRQMRSEANTKMIALTKKLLRVAKKTGDRRLIGYAYYMVADAEYFFGVDDAGMQKNLLSAISYLSSLEEYTLLGRVYNLLGVNAIIHGNQTVALDYYLLTQKYAELADGTFLLGFADVNISYIYMELEDYRQALKYLMKGIRIIRRHKADSFYYRNLSICYYRLGYCYIQLGHPQKALAVLGKSQELYEKASQPTVFPGEFVLDGLAVHTYHALSMEEECNRYLEKLMKVIETYEVSVDSLDDIIRMGEYLLSIGRSVEAGRILQILEVGEKKISVVNLKLMLSEFRLHYYEVSGNKDQKDAELVHFYRLTQENKREKMLSDRFMLDVRQKLEEMTMKQKDLEREKQMLVRMASYDELTGLPNRYSLNAFSSEAFERAFARQTTLAFEILDIDYFKQYNDTYGHQAGDEVLQLIAGVLTFFVKSHERVYAGRYGGDEFVVLYENYTDDEVMEMANELRRHVRDLRILNEGVSEDTYLSISQGIRNTVPHASNKIWDYMYAADNALYDVKKQGKGGVEILHKVHVSEKSLREAKRSPDIS